MKTAWTPDSWRKIPVVQMPDYADQDKLKTVEARLAGYPPLVFAGAVSYTHLAHSTVMTLVSMLRPPLEAA